MAKQTSPTNGHSTEPLIITARRAGQTAVCQNCFFRTKSDFCRFNPPTVMRIGSVYSDNAELAHIKNPVVDWCSRWHPQIETTKET